MSPATTHVPRPAHRDRVDAMLDRGDSLARVGHLISKTEPPRSNRRERESRHRRTSMVASAVAARRHIGRGKRST
jgi:hypothetical protein